MKTVLITGADRGLGYGMAKSFLSNGYRVIAGQFMPEWPELSDLKNRFNEALIIIPLDVSSTQSVEEAYKTVCGMGIKIDYLINCAGVVGADDSYLGSKNPYNINVIGAMRMVETFLPLVDGEKRLCFVSSEAGSISVAHRQGNFAYTTSKTMLNMFIKRMFIELYPKGYKFRILHPGWVRSYMSGKKQTLGRLEPEQAGFKAFNCFTEDRGCEDVLYVKDVYDQVWPF